MEAAVAIATYTIHSFRPTKTRVSGSSYDCPSEVDQKQLDELHLSIRYPEKKE
jgi:hypothetical protein